MWFKKKQVVEEQQDRLMVKILGPTSVSLDTVWFYPRYLGGKPKLNLEYKWEDTTTKVSYGGEEALDALSRLLAELRSGDDS